MRTWTIIRQSFLSGFEVPFILVDVELVEQPHVRMIGRLLEDIATPIQLGDAVDVAFEDVSAEVAIPAFKLERCA